MFNPSCPVKTAFIATFFENVFILDILGFAVHQSEFSTAIEHLIDINYLSHEILNTIACLSYAPTHFVTNVTFCNNSRIL